ncbi:hypothetical protein Leryth_015755 [Lithospermum erythrorhizon]|nr:hypothetical protein Leryth_015755 [Lithospermum erythrorhizon]
MSSTVEMAAFTSRLMRWPSMRRENVVKLGFRLIRQIRTTFMLCKERHLVQLNYTPNKK